MLDVQMEGEERML